MTPSKETKVRIANSLKVSSSSDCCCGMGLFGYRSHRWLSNGSEGKLAIPTLSGSGFLFHLSPRVL
jgi:hypothetical protein